VFVQASAVDEPELEPPAGVDVEAVPEAEVPEPEARELVLALVSGDVEPVFVAPLV
jgi:hypothetical protein